MAWQVLSSGLSRVVPRAALGVLPSRTRSVSPRPVRSTVFPASRPRMPLRAPRMRRPGSRLRAAPMAPARVWLITAVGPPPWAITSEVMAFLLHRHARGKAASGLVERPGRPVARRNLLAMTGVDQRPIGLGRSMRTPDQVLWRSRNSADRVSNPHTTAMPAAMPCCFSTVAYPVSPSGSTCRPSRPR